MLSSLAGKWEIVFFPIVPASPNSVAPSLSKVGLIDGGVSLADDGGAPLFGITQSPFCERPGGSPIDMNWDSREVQHYLLDRIAAVTSTKLCGEHFKLMRC